MHGRATARAAGQRLARLGNPSNDLVTSWHAIVEESQKASVKGEQLSLV